MSYLNTSGLIYLWNKIKATFVTAADLAAITTNMVTTNTEQIVTAKKSGMVINENVQALTDGTSIIFDSSKGSIATLTVTQACTISFTSNSGDTLTLLLTNGGSQTVTWTSVKWADGAAPTLTASGVDCITIINVGGVLYGVSAGGFV